MEDIFGPLLFVVVAVAGIVALIAFMGAGKVYDQVGRGAFSIDRDESRPSAPESDPARDDEIRQMLTARNALRASHGGSQVDVETELAALTRPAADPALREEVTQLVMAKNARRAARGLEPLDVEAEVERQLRSLGG